MTNELELRAEVVSCKEKFGLTQSKFCPAEERELYSKMKKDGEKLPKNVYVDSDGCYWKAIDADLTEEEIEEYLKYKKLSMIRTIKNCLIYFTTISVVSLAFYIIMIFIALGMSI